MLEWLRNKLNERAARKVWAAAGEGGTSTHKEFGVLNSSETLMELLDWIGDQEEGFEVDSVKHPTHECFCVTRRTQPGGLGRSE